MIIVPGQFGRLGNRLQLSAYVAAVALGCRRTAVLGCLEGHAHLFEGSSADALRRFPVPAVPAVEGPRTSALRARYALTAVPVPWPGVRRFAAPRLPGVILDEPSRLAEIAAARTVVLRGYYFYAPTLLMQHADEIRAYFRLVPPLRERVERFLARERKPRAKLVGVHIRHGDYRQYAGGDCFFTTDQYAGLMRRIESLLAPTAAHFIVCSDESHPPGAFGSLSWQPGPGTPVEDLYALAGCDYLLGPRSTFNRWSSFVGNVPRYEILDIRKPISLADFAPATDLTVPTAPAAA